MDLSDKVQNLGRAARLECDGPPQLAPPVDRGARRSREADFLADSVTTVIHPQRGPIPILRTLQTSACERNCFYCPFRAGRNYRRVSLKPEELAGAFDQMQRRKLVDGLFLSSGIVGGGARAMDSMLATAEILRRKYRYSGYLHLKIMPGAETAQIEQAARLADRLSINLEGANAQRLASLAPGKDFWQELHSPLDWLHEWKRARRGGPSLVTQFVVGPAGESDRELLQTVETLYRQVGLSRAYYSAFRPVSDTPLAGCPPTPHLRQHRLYQSDWLLRFYGFSLAELPFDGSGRLPLGIDPKLAWAQRHLAGRPLEINRATQTELLRIPGIGPKSAAAIIAARREGRLLDLNQLRRLGAQADRAAPFILLNGRQPAYQLSLPLLAEAGW